MKVTLTQYREMPDDLGNNNLPLGGKPLASAKLTAAGSFAATDTDCRFVRIATDTAIHINFGAAAADTDAMMPANTVEYFGCREDVVIAVILA